MACGYKSKSCHAKSCQRCYNNTAQPFAAGNALQLQVAGSSVVDTGVSIEAQPMGYTILKTGLYHVTCDIVAAVATAGNGTLQVYLDGVGLPCTIKTVTLSVGSTEIHTETDLAFAHCCPDINHSVVFVFTPSVPGSVSTVCSGVVKMA